MGRIKPGSKSHQRTLNKCHFTKCKSPKCKRALYHSVYQDSSGRLHSMKATKGSSKNKQLFSPNLGNMSRNALRQNRKGSIVTKNRSDASRANYVGSPIEAANIAYWGGGGGGGPVGYDDENGGGYDDGEIPSTPAGYANPGGYATPERQPRRATPGAPIGNSPSTRSTSPIPMQPLPRANIFNLRENRRIKDPSEFPGGRSSGARNGSLSRRRRRSKR